MEVLLLNGPMVYMRQGEPIHDKKKVKFNLIYKYIYIRDGSSLILSYITETFIDPIFFFTNMDLYKVKYLFYRADL